MTVQRDYSFRDHVLDQLRGLGDVSARAMFGGHGLYRAGAIFGIVYQGRLYFRTDEASRAEYEARGSAPFRPNVKQRLHSYYEVPADVLEDPAELTAWAQRAMATHG